MSSHSKGELRQDIVGKQLWDTEYSIPSPAAILDLAKIETNCERMLRTVERLDLGWRPHVKTHKTIELTKIQVGNKKGAPVNIIVSTVLEAEKLLPLLKEYQASGRNVNVLYSFPLHPSALSRLSRLSQAVGPDGLSIMIDNPAQLAYAERLKQSSGNAPLVFLKIDGGYHRAGVIPESGLASALTKSILQSETDGNVKFLGLYIHAGHSYETRKDWQALEYLLDEFTILGRTAEELGLISSRSSLTLSVGASPTATSLQHPDIIRIGSEDSTSNSSNNTCSSLRYELDTLKGKGFKLEVHAGVYPTLDLQQLATHARDLSLLSCSDIAISILADVVSLYPGRGESGTTEALINVGCLGLGREPCQDMGSEKGVHYNGWGIPMPWPDSFNNPAPGPGFPAIHGGWQVGKISQEHGIMKWRGDPAEEIPLKVGQRIRIWPNHACIAGSGFGHYLVVDSRKKGAEDIVIDVWQRWSGW